MSALLARLLDDAALCPPGRAPADAALPAHREAARDRVVGRLRCPASRFADLRTRLVPEDFLDLVLVADTGIEDLPDALDAACAEPRVRPRAVEIALPGDADQARATAVMLARLPAGPRAHIGVRRSPGRARRPGPHRRRPRPRRRPRRPPPDGRPARRHGGLHPCLRRSRSSLHHRGALRPRRPEPPPGRGGGHTPEIDRRCPGGA
ncbi:hypothetical protein [Actinomadura madurae]|uniref:hypothetical protein n=1 Tax=Actinomadura madurae TaxID=1993 RepID=UPI0020D21949|nr:hypothetical protein [Actinomadura madurae]MCQ0006072.1 hypothetical protein [Actinomadura madurae]MCQ0018645.1 hypothetical protein [Actinomadura madurae]